MGNSKTYKIELSNPCNEDWLKMEYASDGRFCNSCQKTVIDFTSKTDDEIISFLSKNPSGCGRFYKNQIETIRFEFEANILNSNLAYWKKFLVVLMVCFGIELFNINFAFAQINQSDTAVESKEIAIDNDSLLVDSFFIQTVDSPKTIIPKPIESKIEIKKTYMLGFYSSSSCVEIPYNNFWDNPLSHIVLANPFHQKPFNGDIETLEKKIMEVNTDILRKDQNAKAYIANKNVEESPKPKEENNRHNEYLASISLSPKPRRRRFKTPNKKPNQPSE